MAKLCFLANAASTHTEKWVLALSERGWEIDILSFLPAEFPQARVHVIPRLIGGKADAILRQAWAKRKIAELEPDLIHAHYATSFGLLGGLARRHPLIISAWGSDIFSFPKISFLHKNLLKWILGQADVLCSSSEIMAQEMQSYIRPEQTVEIVPFGVDMTRFAPPQQELSAQVRDCAVVFGVAKGLHTIYGLDLLIAAFAQVHDRFPQALLRIAGDGPERSFLENLARELGIAQSVEWLGAIANSKVADFYRNVDIVVIPSRQESFGVTAVEGSACGRPVIASNIGGLAEIIVQEKTGLLVPAEDVSELSRAMEKLVANPSLRDALGRQGRAHVLKYYDWQRNVTQMEQVYKRVLSNK